MHQLPCSNMLRNWSMFFVAAVLLLQSCSNRSQNGSSAISEKEPASESIEIRRYEKALFALDKHQLRKGLSALNPEFSFFLGREWQDTMNILRIYNFLDDKNIVALYNLTEQKYPDVSALAVQLTKAFGVYRQSYPEKPLPAVYTYVSGLDIETPVYFSDTAMAIGLDLFLGSDVKAYAEAGLPQYKILRFTPDHLLPQCMLAVSDHIIRYDETKNSLLDEMVAAGKALYFLDVTLPGTADRYKIGYSEEQMQWCQTHESDVWAFIIENELLFSSDPAGVAKLITDSPFTSGFGSDSPGRLGVYIGWQIVRDYIENAGNVTLRQLMENTDSQHILKESRYKPAKR